MEVSTQFDRLSSWLRGQLRSVDRVEFGHSSAEDLVSTAEYEIGRLRRELGLLSLEPEAGLALLNDASDALEAARTTDLVRNDYREAVAADSFEAREAEVVVTEADGAIGIGVAHRGRGLADRLRDLDTDAA